MPVIDEAFCSQFGFDPFFRAHAGDLPGDCFVARVIGEEKGLYRLQSSMTDRFWGVVRGKLRFDAHDSLDLPAVGDWVVAERDPGNDRGSIQRVLPRKGYLHRKSAGESEKIQVLAANVDVALLLTSVNDDLNERRLERYIAVARSGGAVPVIVLTKADLRPQAIDGLLSEISRAFPGVEAFALRSDRFDDDPRLPEHLRMGSTSVLLGSSGVGKSTLANFLAGADVAKTQDIRAEDDKGRHTTTTRSMYVSRFGGLVIDTPGMRELGLLDHADGILEGFSDLRHWTERCRFRDCGHSSEPGCAVKEGLADGTLPAERWANFQKLQAELRFQARKADPVSAAREKKTWKKRHADARERDRIKRKGFPSD